MSSLTSSSFTDEPVTFTSSANVKKRKLPDWMVNSSDKSSTYPKLVFDGTINYCYRLEDIITACEEILYEVDRAENFVFGFDAEWPVHRSIGGSGKTGVIQICQNEKICYIFHVYNLFKLPAILVDILQHSKVKLVGLNINSDIWKLGRDFGIKASQIVEHNCIELAVLAKSVLKTTQVWSLESLVKHLLKKGINKSDELRKSDWSEFLSDAQQLYAATDAFASLMCYLTLNKLSASSDL